MITIENANDGDMQSAILGLRGIFGALSLLVIHHAGKGMVTKDDRDEHIRNLIVAGRTITEEISGRF